MSGNHQRHDPESQDPSWTGSRQAAALTGGSGWVTVTFLFLWKKLTSAVKAVTCVCFCEGYVSERGRSERSHR